MASLSPGDASVVHPPTATEFDYELPAELIAQTPAPERDGARLMVVRRDADGMRHDMVRNLPGLLRAGDLLVFNDARVRPARIFARTPTGGAVELLLVRARDGGEWDCLGRPAKRLRVGAEVRLADGSTATVHDRLGPGRYSVAFGGDVARLLARHGELPLPPYIKRPDGPLPLDLERYQTVFAARDEAIAAPTAGLHFTPALLAALASAGVGQARVTLAVGPGTFLPLRDDAPSATVEPEWAEVPASTVEAIARTKASGGRIIAVGTTTTRALESAALASGDGAIAGGGFWADAFIRPPFRFRIVDALLTNFHLPRSTLLMLVSAFAGRDRILTAYTTAVRERYRFYSYGDAMLIF